MQKDREISILMRKIRVALTPKDWLLKTTLSNGAIVYGKNRPGFGGRGIYLFRDAIEPEFEHLEKFLDPQGTFIDVGANTGIYTIKAAKYYGSEGTVLSIEPFPDVLATLFHSIRVNGFANVRLRNFCAGEKTSSANLWLNHGNPHSFSLLKHEDKASCFSTLTVALDDLFEWEGLNRLDYLKIDVEGAEQQVLAGASKIIAKYRPIIQVEVILKEISFNFPSYSVFLAPNSLNKVYIPNESSKIDLPKQLGWEQVK
jgi:FkbM family methyltransferase